VYIIYICVPPVRRPDPGQEELVRQWGHVGQSVPTIGTEDGCRRGGERRGRGEAPDRRITTRQYTSYVSTDSHRAAEAQARCQHRHTLRHKIQV